MYIILVLLVPLRQSNLSAPPSIESSFLCIAGASGRQNLSKG